MQKIDFSGSFCLLFLIFFLFACKNENKFKLPTDARIVAKYYCRDEFISPNNSKCSDVILPFLKANENDCSFRLDNFEFDISRKYVFDEKGNLETFWRYLSEGPVVDSLKNIEKDTAFMKEENLYNLHPALDLKNNTILEQGKRFEIEKVFPLEKIIIVKKDSTMSKEDTRVLYQYF